MSRDHELAHMVRSVPAIDSRGVGPDAPNTATAPKMSEKASAFVVKLRNASTRSWGNQVEVSAASAREAAEQVAGEPLVEGGSEREHLRARVWNVPFGSAPDLAFYSLPRL